MRLVEVISPVGSLIVALLMVSKVPYPHLTKQMFRGRRSVGHVIQLLLGAMIIIVIREWVLFLIFWIYALALPARYVLLRNLRRDSLPAPDAFQR